MSRTKGMEYIAKWILCPICGSKTRLKIRADTELKNFPLFCPNPDKPEKILQFLHISSTIKKSVLGNSIVNRQGRVDFQKCVG